jgi:hypothetical protein
MHLADELRLRPERFPNLTEGTFAITSEATPDYNCVAWAAGVTDRWIDHFEDCWPSGIRCGDSPADYAELYKQRGFELCDSGEFEQGYVKVAIYGDDRGLFTHVALQKTDGRWTSKMGGLEDIEHAELTSLCGRAYGEPVLYLRKAR